MFVQKQILLLMYRIQANLDEKAVAFFTPLPGLKKLVFFIIIYLWEKTTKKLQCHNILWHEGYLL